MRVSGNTYLSTLKFLYGIHKKKSRLHVKSLVSCVGKILSFLMIMNANLEGSDNLLALFLYQHPANKTKFLIKKKFFFTVGNIFIVSPPYERLRIHQALLCRRWLLFSTFHDFLSHHFYSAKLYNKVRWFKFLMML